MRRYVLDAWAVLAWLQDERPAADRVDELLRQAEAGRVRLSMNIVNVGEVYYLQARRASVDTAEAFLHDLRRWPVRVTPAGHRLVLEAARLKAEYPLSYADAFAVATARREGAVLVTGDPEISALPEDVVTVERLRRTFPA